MTKVVPPFDIDRIGQVATLRFKTPKHRRDGEQFGDGHWMLGEALDQLRWDNDVRVVVLTGASDGDFMYTHSSDEYNSGDQYARIESALDNNWNTSNGPLRTMQALVSMEKPVVARVNGDATQFGQTVVFGCDFIIAREDAIFADVHMGLDDGRKSDGTKIGTSYAIVPGDGALAWIPMLMSPQKAKEYLMLAKPYTGRELADMNIINYAVPLDQLDAVTDDIVKRLLARPARALAYTKRAASKQLVSHLNLSMELGDAYEKVTLYDHVRHDFKNRLTF